MKKALLLATVGLVALTASVLVAQTSDRRPMTPADVHRIQDVGDLAIAPDGEWVAYTVRTTDVDKDRRSRELWMVAWDGRDRRQLTHSESSESHPRFSPDGRYLGFLASRGGGDDDVYLVASVDAGATFASTETRIDDDTGGGSNQRQLSLAVDARTGIVSAAWEDRRSGADIYFAQSTDSGATFGTNVATGVGLNGDQTNPKAVIDRGRNVYVMFVDTSNGQRE